MPTPAVSTVIRQRMTGLRQLTLSAGVGTDAERLAGATGDGLARGSGFSVYPAANAAVVDATLNGNFETNTTGWANNAAGGVISRITTDAKFGAACLQTVNDGTGANQGPTTAMLAGFTAGNVYTFHFWPKSVSGATAIRFRVDWYRTDGTTFISSSTADLTLTAAWTQHAILTATAPALGVKAQLFLINTAATAATYNLDGVQIDNGSVALLFDPANTRVAGRVQLPVAGLFTITQGWIALRTIAGRVNSTTGYNFNYQDADNNERLSISRHPAIPDWVLVRLTGGAGTDAQFISGAPAIGQTVTVTATWTATTARIKDSTTPTFASGANSSIPVIASSSVDIGSVAGGFQNSSAFPWVLCGKGVLSTADAAVIDAFTNAVPTLDQIARLSLASKPTCLVPAKTQDAILLPAYFEGAH